MEKHRRLSQSSNFRKLVRVFGFFQTFITIFFVHLSLVFGFQLIIKSRSYAKEGNFIQGIGVAVIVFGLLGSVFWKLITNLATEGMLLMADIADDFFQQRKDSLSHKQSKKAEAKSSSPRAANVSPQCL